MEKIVVGVPYEISIEPSVDVGKFDAEIVINFTRFNVGVPLKPIKKAKNKYSFIIPSDIQDHLDNKSIKYYIYVYKENARFEVDKGFLMFIDETAFNVDKDSKFIKIDDKTTKSEVKHIVKKDDKTKSTTIKPPVEKKKTLETTKPETTKPVEDSKKNKVDESDTSFDTTLPDLFTKAKSQKVSRDFADILLSVEERNRKKDKRDKINKSIQEAIVETKKGTKEL